MKFAILDSRMPAKLSVPAPPRPRRRRPKQAGGGEGRYHLKAIGRALEVLGYFTEDSPQHSLKEISELAHMPEASLFRTLLTLKDYGYLEQNADGSYELPPALKHAQLYLRAARLKSIAHPHLTALSTQFDETASLAMLFGDEIRVLDTVETFQEIRVVNRPGRILPPHCSSLGKAVTAFQPPELLERILEVYGLHKRTEHTVTDRRALAEEYAVIRERGHAFDREETVIGGVCIGVPVWLGGRPRAALSISSPLVRMSAERESAMIEALKRHARELEQDFAAAEHSSRH